MMEIPDAYRFLNIKINQFACFEENFDRQIPELNVSGTYSYGFDLTTGHFRCLASITYSQCDKIVMKIETEALYQLMDVAIGEFVKGNTLIMPSEAVRYFTSMLYGATRGILACKLESTPLASIVLPPDNLDKIITNPLVIPIGNDA